MTVTADGYATLVRVSKRAKMKLEDVVDVVDVVMGESLSKVDKEWAEEKEVKK